MIFVFDLDGVLADDTHRVPFIKQTPKDFKSFYEAIPLDAPIRPMIELCALAMLSKHQVEFWTNRPEYTRKATEDWLEKHHIGWGNTKLRMRLPDDGGSATDVKRGWLLGCFPCERPDIVFEDNPANVKMFRENGILCIQSKPHD